MEYGLKGWTVRLADSITHSKALSTSGRYVGSPEGSTQPGIYWVNTYKL